MKNSFRRSWPLSFRFLTVAGGVLLPLSVAHAQLVVGDAVPGAAPANRLGADAQDKVAQGRDLLDEGNPRSVVVLRDGAQSSLALLNAALGSDALDADVTTFPTDALTASLLARAAEAHAYWGFASDRFGQRDEAITAWTRAVLLNNLTRDFVGDSRLITSARNRLNLLLDGGLPLVAPDDVMEGLDTVMRQGAWGLHSETFDSGSQGAEIGDKTLPPREFLITTGKLLPPRVSANTDEAWFKVPSYYRSIDLDKLPLALQLDKMVAGYARATSGPNAGQWQQVVRVYYASPFLTKDKRDDLPRARRLVEQFLRVHSLMAAQLGATNLYARGEKDEGVTTLWLLEVSALWPTDEDDPRILTQLGPLMPNLNAPGTKVVSTPETTTLVRPWVAIAGQNEGAPGEILFWKAAQSRPESEWLRELFHEYGHVALPPIGGFRAPLEPFGNGIMGETLGMLWAASAPEAFAPELDAGSKPNLDAATTLRAATLAHVNTYARPARAAFVNAGPASTLRLDGTRAGLQYLGGLTVYLERVYGGKMLGRVLNPLAQRGSNVQNLVQRRNLLSTASLFDAIPVAWRDPWNNEKTLPVWLPGAMGLDLSAQTLANRDKVTLKAKSITPVWLWVPPGAVSLRIEGQGAGSLRSLGLPFQAATNSVRVYFTGPPGWQKFALSANDDAQISSAQFERK